MKIVICVFAFAAVALAYPEEKYTDKYDSTNLDELLKNPRVVKNYSDCLLEKPQAKCNSEAKELRSHMKEAIETDCAKCTDTQRDSTEKVIRYLIQHYPEIWAQLKAKYDPDGTYAKKHEERLSAPA